MDKARHRQIYYVKGENKACYEVNKPQFRQTTCLDRQDQYFEIEAAKHGIKLDLPVQLGFFTLQYAKLRMLQFYFDFLDQYVDRSDFEYMEMDTLILLMYISFFFIIVIILLYNYIYLILTMTPFTFLFFIISGLRCIGIESPGSCKARETGGLPA